MRAPASPTNSGFNLGSSETSFALKVQYLNDLDPFQAVSFPEPTRPPSFTFNIEQPLCEQISSVHRLLKAPHQLADCTFQLTCGPNTVYLDLEQSLAEINQTYGDEETANSESNSSRPTSRASHSQTGTSCLDLFNPAKKVHLTLRTALPVRVHSCITKLYNSTGRDLRRALFSLKTLFKEDDFVQEFCSSSEGLTCLIKIGSGETQTNTAGNPDNNYQNYILRAYEQIMEYVDGMEGVSSHEETIRWLYSLINSDFRILARTSLKLLCKFVNYKDDNLVVMLNCVKYVDGKCWWWTLCQALGSQESAGTGIDHEVIAKSMFILNKTLAEIPDSDEFYDNVDSLEKQGVNDLFTRIRQKCLGNKEILKQLNVYNGSIEQEDRKTEDEDDQDRIDESAMMAMYRKTSRRHSVATHSSPSDRTSIRGMAQAGVIKNPEFKFQQGKAIMEHKFDLVRPRKKSIDYKAVEREYQKELNLKQKEKARDQAKESIDRRREALKTVEGESKRENVVFVKNNDDEDKNQDKNKISESKSVSKSQNSPKSPRTSKSSKSPKSPRAPKSLKVDIPNKNGVKPSEMIKNFEQKSEEAMKEAEKCAPMKEGELTAPMLNGVATGLENRGVKVSTRN